MAREQMTEEQLRAVARQIGERRQLIARLRPDPRDGESDDGRERVRRGSAGDDLSRRDRFVLRARGRDEDESEGRPVGVRGPPGARGSVGHGGNTSGGGTPGGELARASGRGGSPHGDDRAAENGAPDGDAIEGPNDRDMLLLGEGGNAILEIPGLASQRGPTGGPGAVVGAHRTTRRSQPRSAHLSCPFWMPTSVDRLAP
jgi:hypothetical protein